MLVITLRVESRQRLKPLPAFREDMDGHFVALIDRLDEVLFRELEDGGPGRLPAEAKHPSQP